MQERREAGRRRRKEEGKEKNEKGKKKMEKKKKNKGEREIAPAGFVAAAVTRRACAPVGCDTRIEETQGDGTAIGFGCRDRFFGSIGRSGGGRFRMD